MRKFNSAEGLNFSIKRLIGVVCLLLCPVVHGLNVDGQSIVSKAKSRTESYNIEMNMAPANMPLESFVYWAYTYCEDFRRCIDKDIPESGYQYAQQLLDSCLNARDVVMRLCLHAQEFRNHIHLVLSDLLANVEYDLKAKSPGDSDGISLDELRAIQEQIRKISVLSANNADLLQFMEGDGLDKLEASLKEGLQVIPQASKSLIIEIINAYKSKAERYTLDLSKNGKLKVYLGAVAKPNLVSAEVQADAPAKPAFEVSSPVELVSVDAPAKPTLEVSSPAIVDEFDKPQETKLSFSDAVGVDKQLGNSKAKTPPASPVRRSPFLSQFKEPSQQTPSPRKNKRKSHFSLDGKVSYNEQAWHTGRVPTGDASKPRQNDFYRPRSPHDKDGASYPDSAEQRQQKAQAFIDAQQSKLEHVKQEARDAAMRSQIRVSGER